MPSVSSIICQHERWYAPGETYCLNDPGSHLVAKSYPTSDELSGQAFVRADVETRFQPLDHCLAYSQIFFPGKRCDGMVVSKSLEHLAFVELKNARRGWLDRAVDQLRVTICKLRDSNPEFFSAAKVRRAYIANRRSKGDPQMHTQTASRREAFRGETNFILMVSPKIELEVV